MSQSIYNPLNLNNPVPVDFNDKSDHTPFTHCFGKMSAHYGKTHSPETKKQISEALKGKKRSPEHKKNLSKVRMGKNHSPETKKKISEAMKGNKNAFGTLNQ